MNRHERFSAFMRAAIGLSFVIGFFALIDWAAEGRTLEYALGIWNEWPELMRLVVVCLTVGMVVVCGFTLYIIHTAEPVDENECPIQVKGRR